MKSVSRISLELELYKQFKRLKRGIVLDVGAKDTRYKKLIPYKEYKTLDISPNHNPDYIADIHDLSKLPRNHFDTVIATEILEHLIDPPKAINEISKIIKKGGVCIASTRFICNYHPDPKDYYRFTWDSLKYIFRDFRHVEIIPHGNRIQVLWHLISIFPFRTILGLFNPLIARLNFKKTNVPAGFIIYAVK